MEKAVTCKREGKGTSLGTYGKLKPLLFRANTLYNRLFWEPPTVYRRKHVVSRLFHRKKIKANKMSKSEGERIRKVEYAHHFSKCAWSKLVHACRNYSLPYLAHLLRHSIVKLEEHSHIAENNANAAFKFISVVKCRIKTAKSTCVVHNAHCSVITSQWKWCGAAMVTIAGLRHL